MTNYGDNGHPYLLCTAESSGPSGSIIYMLAKSFRSSVQSQQRKRILRGGRSSKLASGKKTTPISISQALVLISEINGIKTILDAAIDDSSQLYLFHKLTTSTYEQFENSSGTYVNYQYVYVEEYTLNNYSDMFMTLDLTLTDGWEV